MGEPLFEVDENSGIPIWIQLRNRLMYLVDSGHYANGGRLPTVRALAADINVNYHTVNKVYTNLEYEGCISSKRVRGAFVCKEAAPAEEEVPGDIVMAEAIRQCVEFGMALDDVEAHFAHALEVARAGTDSSNRKERVRQP